MKRRIISFVCAAALLICNMMLFASVAFAEGDVTNWSIGGESNTEKEYPKGYWKRVSVVNEGPDSQFDNATVSGGNGHYTCSAKCIDDRISAYHDGEHLTSCMGESATITIDIDEPPAIIKPGEEISLNVSPSYSVSTPHDSLMFYTCQVHVGYGYGGYNADGKFKDSNGKEYLGIDRTWQYDDYYAAAGLGNHFIYIDSDNILRHTFDRSSSKMWICTTFSHGRGEDAIDTYYCYEWIGDREPPKNGEEEETDGYWELSETEISEQSEYAPSYCTQAKTVTKYEDGKVSAVFKANDDYKTEDGDQKLIKGDTVSASLVYTKPKNRYKPYEKIEIEVSAASDLVTRSGSLYDLFLGLKASCYANAGYMYERDSGMSFSKRSTRDLSYVAEKSIGSTFREPVYSGTLTGLVPDKDPDDEPDKASMWIYVNVGDSDSTSCIDAKQGSIIYKYRWVSGKMPAGSGSERDSGSSGNKLPEQTVFQLVETNADERPGEDSGHSMIPAIVIGVSIAVGAGGAGAVASSASKNKDGGKKDEPSYRMYIRKDFGDTIQKAVPPVRVYARIASSGGGSVVNETGLSSNIMIYTETQGVNVTTLGLVSGAQCAEIEIPDPSVQITEAVIVFRYRGRGGVFTEKVRFKVAGEPYIEFVVLTGYGVQVEGRDEKEKKLLLGDTEADFFHIRLQNLSEDASSINPEYPQNCKVKLTFTRVQPFIYKIEAIDGTGLKPSMFGEYPLEYDIPIVASNEKHEEARAMLKFKLYPEGLFIVTTDLRPDLVHADEGYLDIYTNDFSGSSKPSSYTEAPEMRDPGAAYAAMLKATEIKAGICKWDRTAGGWKDIVIYDAYPIAGGEAFDEKSCGDVIDVCAGTPDHVLKKFRFEVRFDKVKKTTVFKPNVTVIMDSADEKMMLRLQFTSVERTYKSESIKEELMLRLIGENGSHEKLSREKEINAISRLIYAMQLGEVEPAMQLLSNMRGRYVAAYELTLTRYAMYDIGARYWHDVSVGEVKTADFYTPMIWTATTVRYVADTAFSYIIIAYCKTKGWPDDIIEPFASGLLKMVEDFYADISMEYYWGTESKDHLLLSTERWKKMFWDSLDSMMFGAFVTPSVKSFDLKRVVCALSIASGINFYKNLRESKDPETGKYDLYKALAATVASVSVQTLKIVLFERTLPWLKKSIGSRETVQNVGKYASDVGKSISEGTHKVFIKVSETVTGNKYAGPIVKKFAEFVQTNYRKFVDLGLSEIDSKAISNVIEDNGILDKLKSDAFDKGAELCDDNIKDFYVTGLKDAFGSFGYFDIDVMGDDGQLHTVSVSWAASLCEFIDYHLRSLGFHQADNIDFSASLPNHIPYVSNERIVEALRSARMNKEADYVDIWNKTKDHIQNRSGINVSHDTFLPQSEPPTFDQGTDWHRYAK